MLANCYSHVNVCDITIFVNTSHIAIILHCHDVSFSSVKCFSALTMNGTKRKNNATTTADNISSSTDKGGGGKRQS